MAADFPILRALAQEMAPLVAKHLAAEMRGAGDGWVSQRDSKLGSRNHCDAVRRLLAEGDYDRAVIRNKLHLLRKDAYDAELVRAGRRSTLPPRPPVSEEDAEVESFKRVLGVR